MKRNAPRSSGRGDSGPLMTDHLQDLDNELQLLKRKREMIQQQKQRLENDTAPYNAQQPFYSQQSTGYSHYSGQRDFAYLYDDDQHSALSKSQNSSSSLTNYQSVSSRPQPQTARQKNFIQPSPVFNKPQTLNTPIRTPQPSKITSIYPKVDKNFKPDKVTKPRPAPVLTNIKVLPTETRKDLVNKTKELVKPISKAALVDNEVYLPDKVASTQVEGRLEYALGHIVKEIRESYPKAFQQPVAVRAMKKLVRERIRELASGKKITNYQPVVDMYRRKYPKNTDIEIAEVGMNIGAEQEANVLKFAAEDPDNFVEKSTKMVIESTLAKIFNKILATQPDNTVQDFEPKAVTVADKALKPLLTKMQDILSQHIPKWIIEHMDQIVNILAEDKHYKAKMREVSSGAFKRAYRQVKFAEESKAMKNGEDNNDCIVVENTNKGEPNSERKNDVIEIKDDEVAPKEKVSVDAKPVDIEQNNQDKKGDSEVEVTVENKGDNQTKLDVIPEKTVSNPNPVIVVKVLCKPALPEKQLMKQFLDKYSPKTIKKHKTIHNLLFVGLSRREDVDAILSQNGITLDGKKVLIKESENISLNTNDKAANEATSIGAKSNETMKRTNEEHILFDKRIEKQIDNLLHSIRKTEEQNDDATIEDVANKNTANNADTNEEANDNNIEIETVQNKNNSSQNLSDEPVKVADNSSQNLNDVEPIEVADDNDDVQIITEEQCADKQASQDNNSITNKDTAETSEGKSTKNTNEKTQEKEIVNSQIEDVKVNERDVCKTRASARLANLTPTAIKTRRASRLGQNNQ